MKKFISLFFAVVFVATAVAQDAPHSVGPAPYFDRVVPQDPVPFQIGTRAFTQISTTPTFQFGKSFMESCTITNIGTPFAITFPGGLMYRNGIVYTWNQSSPFQLWSIDTVTGIHTLVFNMTGVPQANFTGMYWDGTNVYGVSTSITASQIFTVNMTTGVCTPIGTASTACAGAIFLAGRLGASNGAFTVDIVLDNLYKWNKTTGVATLVGPIGGNANFGQDASFDNADGKLYWMSYTTGPQLRTIDTATGVAGTVLCSYLAQATGIACVPPPGPTVLTPCRSVNIPINDNSSSYDTINVGLGSGCVVTDINIRIDTVFHTWDSDLSFYLRKGGVGVKLINRAGGSGDNFIGTVIDDAGACAIGDVACNTAPFTGTFKPSAPATLTPFNSQPTDGSWILTITDTAGGDTGFLRAWCLVISYTCPTGGIQTVTIPSSYSLSQNYPNPFNPSTKISYGLPKGENVKLVVYDLLGKEVATLVNEFMSAGIHQVDFNASRFASGVYFYRIEAGSYIETRKMLLVK